MGQEELPSRIECDDKDRERAASMSDEGGAAGAAMDMLEQEQIVGQRRGRLRRKRRRLPWMWGAAAASAAIGGAALLRTIAARSSRGASDQDAVRAEPVARGGAGRGRKTAASGAELETSGARARGKRAAGKRAAERPAKVGGPARARKRQRARTSAGRKSPRSRRTAAR